MNKVLLYAFRKHNLQGLKGQEHTEITDDTEKILAFSDFLCQGVEPPLIGQGTHCSYPVSIRWDIGMKKC